MCIALQRLDNLNTLRYKMLASTGNYKNVHLKTGNHVSLSTFELHFIAVDTVYFTLLIKMLTFL